MPGLGHHGWNTADAAFDPKLVGHSYRFSVDTGLGQCARELVDPKDAARLHDVLHDIDIDQCVGFGFHSAFMLRPRCLGKWCLHKLL
ncbi:MAG: hypothetical protein GY945_09085 [Rhodobacteraceae bacterium]|nr:hypothetical protein [Paracoccaceae bacterium]